MRSHKVEDFCNWAVLILHLLKVNAPLASSSVSTLAEEPRRSSLLIRSASFKIRLQILCHVKA